ncbi:MAG: class I SAM-dependent methyltransferase [Nanoarchaeota archaeon]|nr:class I SAM-dependent methyltransferase [Nanoarchaeota archaeon]
MGNVNICCICNSKKYRTYKKVDQYRLLRCKKCGLVYLDQHDRINQVDFIDDAKDDLANKDREKVEYWSFPKLYNKYIKIFHHFFEERLNRIYKSNSHVKTMLDIGCGYGFWMDYCVKRGIKSEGIDISNDAVDYAKKELSLKVWKQDLRNFKKNKKYDLLIMFDIIEHMENPNKTLIACKKLLNKNGLLYIQVPNLLGFKIPMNHGYGLPYHLWQYNYKSLSGLLIKNGYQVVGHWTGPMGIIGEYEKNKSILLKKTIWKLASKLYLGNRLQVLAKLKE